MKLMGNAYETGILLLLGATLTAFLLGGCFREFGIARGIPKRTETHNVGKC